MAVNTKMYCKLKYRLWCIAVVIVCAQLLSPQTTGAPTTVKLRDFGWEPPEQIHLFEANTGLHSILIDHKGQILVGFTSRKPSGPVPQDHPGLSFHVVRFTPDGKANLSLSLPTNSWRNNGIYLSDTDQIIARADDKLQLLQPGSDPQAETSWVLISLCAERCRVVQSPSRRTLLVGTWGDNSPSTVFDLSQVPTAQRCENRAAPYSIHMITDKFAYHTGVKRQLEDFTYRWPLCNYEHHVELPIHARAGYIVLNDEFLITNINYNADKYTNSHLDVISFDGRLKLQQAMAKHESWNSFSVPIRSSAKGNRIAVDITTIRGVNRILDLSGHITTRRIAVYDIDAGKQLASVAANKKLHYRYEFDFSPDGHRLAILEDDLVRVVDIE